MVSMGQIAEEIVSGYVCQSCVGVIDEKEPGFPRTCGFCKGAANQSDDYLAMLADGIGHEKADELRPLIAKTKITEDMLCGFFKISALELIPKIHYKKLKNILLSKQQCQ